MNVRIGIVRNVVIIAVLLPAPKVAAQSCQTQACQDCVLQAYSAGANCYAYCLQFFAGQYGPEYCGPYCLNYQNNIIAQYCLPLG